MQRCCGSASNDVAMGQAAAPMAASAEPSPTAESDKDNVGFASAGDSATAATPEDLDEAAAAADASDATRRPDLQAKAVGNWEGGVPASSQFVEMKTDRPKLL